MSVEDLHSISLKWKFAKINCQIAFKMTASIPWDYQETTPYCFFLVFFTGRR